MVSSYLGCLEHAVLVSIQTYEKGTYAAALRAQVVAVTGNDISLGAIQTTLSRLERKGYLTSSTAPPTSQPGGRRAMSRTRALNERLYAGPPRDERD